MEHREWGAVDGRCKIFDEFKRFLHPVPQTEDIPVSISENEPSSYSWDLQGGSNRVCSFANSDRQSFEIRGLTC